MARRCPGAPLAAPGPMRTRMKFCSACGHRVAIKIPEGDAIPRYVCDSCGTIHYENPKVVVGCVPEYEGRILLCKRAIEPRLGYWTVPAGFMENGETLREGAARETLEEAEAQVEVGELFAIVDVVRAHQVHILFRARMLDGRFGAGHESLECRLVSEDEIPWDDIAFASVRFGLEAWLEDRRSGRSRLHMTAFHP
jgi:ADP-ribose pyrophosphatase YjhB (NUDIX family)